MNPVDTMVVEVEEHLPAPPDRVWALLTDVVRMGGLGPENVANAWEGDERGVGAVFTGRNAREGVGEWTIVCRVVEHDRPHRFAWTTGDPERPSGTWSYELVPADGGTLVRQRFAHGPGFTYLRQSAQERPDKAERWVARRAEELERNMRAVLRAAADLL